MTPCPLCHGRDRDCASCHPFAARENMARRAHDERVRDAVRRTLLDLVGEQMLAELPGERRLP
jgi:hypothetical protein